MAILGSNAIRELAKGGMISPFSEKVKGKGVISYGLSEYSYDFTVGEVKKLIYTKSGVVDPKDPENQVWETVTPFNDNDGKGEYVILNPSTPYLGVSKEYFNLPANIAGFILQKSTYNRCFLKFELGFFEAGFDGNATCQIFNASHLPLKYYIDEGCAQIVLFDAREGEMYGGKHGGVTGIVHAGGKRGEK